MNCIVYCNVYCIVYCVLYCTALYCIDSLLLNVWYWLLGLDCTVVLIIVCMYCVLGWLCDYCDGGCLDVVCWSDCGRIAMGKSPNLLNGYPWYPNILYFTGKYFGLWVLSQNTRRQQDNSLTKLRPHQPHTHSQQIQQQVMCLFKTMLFM